MGIIDTWLNQSDIERIYKVVQGELSEEFVTFDEIKEFKNVLTQVYANKWGITGNSIQ